MSLSAAGTCSRIVVERLLIAVVLCVAFAMPALAQLGTGTINGIVQDSTGAVIPGVNMILSNPGVVGGNQETVTDERGAFQFLRLVPGSTYSVRAELTGFRPAARNNIAISADVNTRVDLAMEVGGLSDEVTVSGEVQLLDTASIQNQQVLSREVLDVLPTGNDLWSIGRIVPSVLVQSYDVGGHNSFNNQTLKAHGSGSDENKYQIDGMDVSHGSGTGSSSTLYFDTFMFTEVNYMSGNNTAEIAQGGVIYNLITKTGTNDFHADFRFTGTNHHLQSDNLSPEIKARLLEGVPARVREVSPNPRNGILKIVDSGLSISGPIVKNKLWFVTTFKLNPMEDLRLGSYEADGTQMVGTNRMRNRSVKISWQATQNNQLHFSHNYNRKGEMTSLDTVGAPFGERAATINRRNRIKVAQAKWTSTLSPRALFDVAYSHHYGEAGGSENAAVGPGALPKIDLTTQTASGAAPYYNYQYPLKPVFVSSMTYLAGDHEFKFGYQFNGNFYGNDAYSVSHYPAGLVARYRSGIPDSVQTYNSPVETQNNTAENALYIQDRWTPIRKMTLNIGLRMEKVAQWFPATCQEETIFIAQECFPAGAAPDWFNVAPRFGMVYDIFGDGSTALKLAANRYWPSIGIGLVSSVNPVRIAATDTRSWTDRNNDRIPQLDELGPSTGFGLGTSNRFDPELERPIVNEFNVEIERQLPGNVVLSVGYFHRDRKRNIGRRNLAVPRESYTPLTVTEVASGRQVTVYNQKAELRGKFDVLVHNTPENDITYNGMDITFNRRMSNRWMMMGGLSVSKNTGRNDQNADLNDPNVQFNDSESLFQNDVPVTFKLSGIYELPLGFRVSGSVQHFTGFPEDTTVLVTSATVPLTQVNQRILVEPRGTTRLPDVQLVDFNVKKLIRVGSRRIEPGLDLFNVFNVSPIQARVTQLGPSYGRPSSILPGRLLRFTLNVGF